VGIPLVVLFSFYLFYDAVIVGLPINPPDIIVIPTNAELKPKLFVTVKTLLEVLEVIALITIVPVLTLNTYV